MFNKRLLSLVPHSMNHIMKTVIFNWFCLISNIVFILTICNFIATAYSNIDKATSIILPSALIIITCAIVRIIFTKLSIASSTTCSQNAKNTLREKIYNHLTKLGVSYTQYVSTSEAVQLSVEGIDQLEMYFGQYMPQLFYSVLAPITLFIVVSTIHLPSAIVLLICVPLIPLAIIAVQKFAKKLLSKYWTAYTDLGDTFLENIQGLTTLKIYQADEEKHKEMNENSEVFRKATMRVLVMQLNSISVMDFVAYGGAGVGIIVSLFGYSKDNISLFGTLAIILLSADFFLPMRRLGSFFHVAMNGIAAADKIFKIIDIPIEDSRHAHINNDKSINIKNLSFSYDNKSKVLENIDLGIKENSFCCFVGESGCGKSTLSSILTGNLRDYTGNIQIGDTELNNISEETLMKNITLVNHNSYIFKGTIEYNLKMGNKNALKEQMLASLETVNLLGFINQENGLNTELSEQGSNLSGGQKQRLAIARALLHDTPIYIFDEATSNIDVESENIIMNTINMLAKTKTVILISHRLANVKNADCIFVMKDGVILEQGTHEQLINSPSFYSKLYNKQLLLENYGKESIDYENN